MKPEEIIKVVEDLNDSLLEICGGTNEDATFFLDVHSNGFNCVIEFLGKYIWGDTDDPRKYDEDNNEYEPLSDFLIRECNKRIDDLQKQKFKDEEERTIENKNW